MMSTFYFIKQIIEMIYYQTIKNIFFEKFHPLQTTREYKQKGEESLLDMIHSTFEEVKEMMIFMKSIQLLPEK